MARNKMRGPSRPQNKPTPAAPDQPTDQVGESDDPSIAAVQDKVRESIPPQFRVAVQRIVLAGSKVMYDPSTHHLMIQALQSDDDPAHAIAMGVNQLVTMLYAQSKGSMPAPAIIPSAILLCCEALDFCEQSGLIKPDMEMVGNAVQIVVSYLMQKMGIKPEDIAKVAQGPQAPPPTNTQQAGGLAPQGAPDTGGGGLIGAALGGANG
jgi:hypothetical protein